MCGRQTSGLLLAALLGQQIKPSAEAESRNAVATSATTINRDLSTLSHDLARLTAEWERVTVAVSAS
jgi:hypothetical protein